MPCGLQGANERERDFGEKIQSYHNDFNRFLPKYKKYEHTGRN